MIYSFLIKYEKCENLKMAAGGHLGFFRWPKMIKMCFNQYERVVKVPCNRIFIFFYCYDKLKKGT